VVIGFISANHPFAASATYGTLRYLKNKIKDPDMRKALTPDYAFGCKRVSGS
jgi:hypothetical protein